MSKAVLFLLATTLGLGFVSLHLVRELRAERGQVQALQARLSEIERAPRPAASPTEVPAAFSPFHVVASHPTDSATAATAPVNSRPAAKPALTSPPQEEVVRQFRENMERQRALLQDPEYREAARSQNKMMVLQMYPELAKALDMNGEEMDPLLNLLADQQLRATETATYWDGAAPPDPAAEEEMRRQATEQHHANEAELADLLGTKMQAWKEYQSTLGVRHQVIQLRSVLASRGAPLQESQSKPLLKALAQEQQREMKEMSANQGMQLSNQLVMGELALSSAGGSMVSVADAPVASTNAAQWQEQQIERMTKRNERMRDAVEHILTPQQLKVFEEEQNTQLKMQRAQMRMMRAQQQAEGR